VESVTCATHAGRVAGGVAGGSGRAATRGGAYAITARGGHRLLRGARWRRGCRWPHLAVRRWRAERPQEVVKGGVRAHESLRLCDGPEYDLHRNGLVSARDAAAGGGPRRGGGRRGCCSARRFGPCLGRWSPTSCVHGSCGRAESASCTRRHSSCLPPPAIAPYVLLLPAAAPPIHSAPRSAGRGAARSRRGLRAPERASRRATRGAMSSCK
jgi:hypothetical protein